MLTYKQQQASVISFTNQIPVKKTFSSKLAGEANIHMIIIPYQATILKPGKILDTRNSTNLLMHKVHFY